MKYRRVVAVALLVPLGLVAVACSSSETSSSTTVPGGMEQPVRAPVVLTAENNTATVQRGTIVTFDMGEPGAGQFVATSTEPRIFRIGAPGGQQGSYTQNASGRAVGLGEATVFVQLEGAENGLGAPVMFKITVE